MKANELMVGDWVKHPNYGNIQIRAIPNTDATYASIPLTAEILEKNGFRQNSAGYMYKCDFRNFQLLNGIESLYIRCSEFYPTIRYVHELQHALRLCGLNDLAENFRIE